jgi:hypothetical protein
MDMFKDVNLDWEPFEQECKRREDAERTLQTARGMSGSEALKEAIVKCQGVSLDWEPFKEEARKREDAEKALRQAQSMLGSNALSDAIESSKGINLVSEPFLQEFKKRKDAENALHHAQTVPGSEALRGAIDMCKDINLAFEPFKQELRKREDEEIALQEAEDSLPDEEPAMAMPGHKRMHQASADHLSASHRGRALHVGMSDAALALVGFESKTRAGQPSAQQHPWRDLVSLPPRRGTSVSETRPPSLDAPQTSVVPLRQVSADAPVVSCPAEITQEEASERRDGGEAREARARRRLAREEERRGGRSRGRK